MNPTRPSARRLALQALTLAALAATAGVAAAQGAAYPNKPVRMVVAFTAGGPTDVVARVIGERLTQMWGQQVIIDNKPGAAGTIGADNVAASPPDGYTLLMATAGNLTVNQHLYSKMKTDPLRDFAPVTQTALVDFVMVTQPGTYKSVKEVIQAAKAKPGEVTTSTSGVGGAPHLAAALFSHAAGVKLSMVPYKGTADAVNAVLSSQVALDFDAASQVMPQIKAGKLVPLAVLGNTRSASLPDVPTMAEAGLASYKFSNWFGLVAPARTPPEVLAKLEADVNKVLQDPLIRGRFQTMGLQAAGGSAKAFGALMKSDSAKWAVTIKDAGISAE